MSFSINFSEPTYHLKLYNHQWSQNQNSVSQYYHTVINEHKNITNTKLEYACNIVDFKKELFAIKTFSRIQASDLGTVISHYLQQEQKNIVILYHKYKICMLEIHKNRHCLTQYLKHVQWCHTLSLQQEIIRNALKASSTLPQSLKQLTFTQIPKCNKTIYFSL